METKHDLRRGGLLGLCAAALVAIPLPLAPMSASAAPASAMPVGATSAGVTSAGATKTGPTSIAYVEVGDDELANVRRHTLADGANAFNAPSIPGLTKADLSPAAVDIQNTSSSTAASLATRTVSDGYGVFMTYNLPGGDQSAYVSSFTEPLYGQATTYR
ncbi:hypothetical protein [Curtobacterium sp. RRHDQ10]|uniref:hypothetical protein n=1 Tax=Curtobacterium phyllosphaerae TaxID=3413379 RepID=UPI003BF2DF80